MAFASITFGLLVCLAVGVSKTSGALVNGRCPHLEGQENFDIHQYLGKWYIIESFVNPLHIHDVCLKFDYTQMADGMIRARIIDNKSVLERFNVQDTLNPSKFHYHLSEEDTHQTSFIETVVLTDYENYGAEFSCVNLVEDFSIQFAWILTREKEVNPDHLKVLKEKLQSLGIDITNFNHIDHSNCEEP